MQRGFKSKAEQIALEARDLAKLPRHSPLPARELATAMGVPVVGPSDIPEMPGSIVTALLVQFTDNWSAVTLCVGDGFFIVHNTAHLLPRQESNLMHELAHILSRHRPARVDAPGALPWATRTYDPAQEEEATWLGGCLQIPRDALVPFVRKGISNTEIATHFGASEGMVRFRRNRTGIDLQLTRAYGQRQPAHR